MNDGCCLVLRIADVVDAYWGCPCQDYIPGHRDAGMYALLHKGRSNCHAVTFEGLWHRNCFALWGICGLKK